MNTTHAEAESAISFRTLPLEDRILTLLDGLKLETPTPIQAQAIPHAVAGFDVIGIAQTGTGKTLAFGLPLMQSISKTGGKALILLPTRELALQVYETMGKFARTMDLRGAVLIGGASMNTQISDIRRNPNIIIATPGRLNDHLQQGTVNISDISVLVLDEADRMLDMGFWPQIKDILSMVPKEKQTMLFSATLSREILDLAKKHMKTPVSIEVSPPGTTAELVSQEYFIIRKDEKVRLLEAVLTDVHGPTIVFTRTKHGATRVMKGIKQMGYSAAEIHSNRSLAQRREALDGFKSGKYQILVATDIAARGIDVKGIELVINYDIPGASEDYVHRIGRTARAGAEGRAITFVMPDERRGMRDIERLIRMNITNTAIPELPPARAPIPHIPEREQSNFGRYNQGNARQSTRSFSQSSPRSSSGFNRQSGPRSSRGPRRSFSGR